MSDRQGIGRPLPNQQRPEDAKTLPFGVAESIDLKIWKQLSPHLNRLTKLKTEIAGKRYRDELKETEEKASKTSFDNEGNARATAYDRLQVRLAKAHEYATQRYAIFRDVWLRLGGIESAGFIRTISWMVIQRQLAAEGRSFERQEGMRFRRCGRSRPTGLPEDIREGFKHLKTKWRERLEEKALEWEAEARGKTLTEPLAANVQTKRDLGGKRPRRPKPSCFASAMKQFKKNPQLTLVEFCRLMDRRAEQFPKSQQYLPPKKWGVRSFMEQYRKRSNTVSRFLSNVRKAARLEGR